MTALTYGTVTGTFGDTSAAVDNPIIGTVTFTPDAAWLLSDGLVTLPTPVTASLVNGAFSVGLVATDDALLNPTDWTYTVTFNLKMGQSPWNKRPINIKVPAGLTTDLATVTPVAASEGNAILKGDTGDAGPQGIQGIPGVVDGALYETKTHAASTFATPATAARKATAMAIVFGS
ncbi:hypothetical protein FCN77_16295 [Arthrobacter sp. 24S4-2]|uniref:hypothetical protein n=1 Tax=Arthrobacter sp. 24S4-2 TaxID=2575374 RepID=UPI0010C78050|nr:hypothetical protein [Arthrobacter sp. 24S4-2]QCO98975.1 hypothetical protein FCN77_16295 [Arthrobacter sp. 24S4-2]